MQTLYEDLFYDPDVEKIFSANALLSYMLRFEKSLAQAQATVGVIPQRCAEIIEHCGNTDNIDIQNLMRDAAAHGNPAIPLIRQLTSRVAEEDAVAAGYIHLGATSQDVIDSAMMMQVRDATRKIRRSLHELIRLFSDMAGAHKNTWMAARSFMQQARPISFGLKVAGWVNPLLRAAHRLDGLLSESFVLQFGGSAGSLYGVKKAKEVTHQICVLLELNDPGKPWHTERDRWVEIATAISILCGSLGKIAQDLVLMAQPEIGEVSGSVESGGAVESGDFVGYGGPVGSVVSGGSSTLPQKRNPVKCLAVLANTNRIPGLMSTLFSCMGHDHERATGKWHAEWETITTIVRLCAGALRQMIAAARALEINPERMLANLELTRGLVYAENLSLALAPHIGRGEAHALVAALCLHTTQTQRHLKQAVADHPVIQRFLAKSEIDDLFSPATSAGMASEFIDKVLSEAGRVLESTV